MSGITVITVNFKTPDLTEISVNTFLEHYPGVPYILIDNGGCPRSLIACHSLATKYENIFLVSNRDNVGHGPALNEGLSLVRTPYAFLLDSDTKAEQGGFLGLMMDEFVADPNTFAVGWLRYVSHNGVACGDQSGAHGFPYVHPYACLLNVAKFRTLPRFASLGAPAINLMIGATAAGYGLKGFPIKEYVWHKVAGTRGMFGGNWKPDTGAQPKGWTRRGI